MNLIQLRYFQAVCLYGTVTKAAEAMNISQPSISLAIKELEEEFSVSLFHRQYRGMRLSEAGKKLFELSKKLLREAENMTRTMEELGEKRHLLRIGVGPMIGSIILPSLYENYFSLHPELRVEIQESARSISLRHLEEGKLDMLFLAHAGAPDPSYNSLKVMELEVVCAMTKSHELAKKERISIRELKEQNLVLFQDTFYNTELIKSRFQNEGITPNVILQSSQVSTIRSMIASGIAMGFLLSPMIDKEKNIRGIPLDPPLKESVSLVWKDDGYPFAEKDRFREYAASFTL